MEKYIKPCFFNCYHILIQSLDYNAWWFQCFLCSMKCKAEEESNKTSMLWHGDLRIQNFQWLKSDRNPAAFGTMHEGGQYSIGIVSNVHQWLELLRFNFRPNFVLVQTIPICHSENFQISHVRRRWHRDENFPSLNLPMGDKKAFFCQADGKRARGKRKIVDARK